MSVQPSEESSPQPKEGAEESQTRRQYVSAIKPLIGEKRITWGDGGSWREDDSTEVPDHTQKPIELKCYELLPYALMRKDLISPEDFRTALKKAKQGYASSFWANYLGGSGWTKEKDQLFDDVKGEVTESFKSLAVQPGDIVILALNGEGMHTVIVSDVSTPGDPQVYSLACNAPENHPVEISLKEIVVKHFADVYNQLLVLAPK